jgi:hypothetical protein
MVHFGLCKNKQNNHYPAGLSFTGPLCLGTATVTKGKTTNKTQNNAIAQLCLTNLSHTAD